MRYEPLRKRVLVESGILLAVLVVLAGLVYFLSITLDESIESNKSSKRILDTIDGEYNALKAKYAFIKQNSSLYEEVKKKQEAGGLSINRPMVLEKFNQYKAQYGLNNLRLSVSPIQDIKDPAYMRKTHSISSSEVSVELDTLSDEHVYDLLDVMQQELPGVSKITKLALSRDHPLDTEALTIIEQKGSYPLVKASIKFTWFSINTLDTPVEAAPNAQR